MQAFKIDDLIDHQTLLSQRWSEFLRVASLSAGIYTLPVGSEDLQRPHSEDEIYVVLRGRAEFECEGERQVVGRGDLLYVPQHAEHRFLEIAEDLVLLVVFAPAEGSLSMEVGA